MQTSMYETIQSLGYVPLTFEQLRALRRRFANDPKAQAFIAKQEQDKLDGLQERNRPVHIR